MTVVAGIQYFLIDITMRIRTRLLSLVLAVLIPSLMAAAVGIWYVYEEEQSSLRQSMRETTRALAQVMDKEIANRETLLRTLAASPLLDRENLKDFYEHARTVAASWDTAIILSDQDGRQILNTRYQFGARDLPVLTQLTTLRKEAGPDATIVADLNYTPASDTYSFAVQIPVLRDERVRYYMSIDTFTSQLQKTLNAQRLPVNWLANMTDRKGVVLARSQDHEKYVGTFIGEERLKKLKLKEEGFHESETFRGEPVIAFFSRVPSTGWTFLVAVPKDTLYRSALKAVTFTGSMMLLLLTLAVFGALALGHNIARSIEALGVAAERLGRGQQVSAQRFGTIEMDRVSAVMAHAGDEIHIARADLERRVAEAVETAEKSQRALLQAQKLEALGRLTGGIAHDFNNVLQTLTTGLQVLLFSVKAEREKTLLETCQRAVGKGVELARQLMVFGRVQDARLETVDLMQQIKAALPLLKGALPSNISFESDTGSRLWPVTIDPLQFELALLNLTINARDAMPAGGSLRLVAHNQTLSDSLGDLPAGDYVCCRLIDNGEGMPQEVQASALDPFFTTKSVGKGSGMGLPQAYGFARQSGGTLILHSQVGAGTEVTFYLPRSQQALSIVSAAVNERAGAMSHGKLLFVEDDVLVREAVRPALEAAGFTVTVATSGDEAMRLLQEGSQFDLAFSDVVMPGSVSGIDLAQSLRKDFPRMRIVLATGYSERRIGVPDVRILAKPYNLNELVKALNEEMAAV